MDGSSVMSKFTNIFLFVLCLSFTLAKAGSDHNPLFQKDWKMLASITTQNMQETFKELSNLEIDIAGVDVKNKIIDVLINDVDFNNLSNANFNLSITEVKGVSKGPDPEYKNPDEIEFLIKEWADKYPEITKLESIGKSLEGRDIWALKISDNPETQEVLEPAVMFNSMHHAREIMTPEVSLDIIETLLTKYNSDATLTQYVNNYEIWVIPMFNVDGNNKMWNSDKWWRKNNRGGYGVDLNRNYPGNWNKCNGSSGWRSSQTYRGPKPASEPETKAMMNFVAKVRPVFDISYHSYSELVIYPLGCSPERTSNAQVVEKIGKEIAAKLDYAPGTAWELLYNADGGDIDWMYTAYQVIPFVIELNSRSEGFHPSYAKWRDKTVEKNRAGWMHLLSRLAQSGIRGQVLQNDKAVSNFEIEIYEMGTKSLFQNYLGHTTGMYHLILNPGTYELVFKVDNNIVRKEKVTVQGKLNTLNIKI